MERTTISLPPELHKKLRILAAERGVSMATIIREAIEDKTRPKERPRLKSLGIFDSGHTDTSQIIGEQPVPPVSWH